MKNYGAVKLTALAIAGAVSAGSGAGSAVGQGVQVGAAIGGLRSEGTAGVAYGHIGDGAAPTNLWNVAKTKDEKAEFETVYSQFMKDTDLVSSIHTIMVNPSFARLIGFGPQAVPWLLHRIDDSPMRIMPILSAITRENPVAAKYRGNVDKMKNAWVDWGKRNILC